MIAVAFSGGADSTLLLLQTWAQAPDHTIALHVNHQLQAAAPAFEAHVQAFCAERSIPLHIARVEAKPHQRQSPEDAARLARYQALAQMAKQSQAAKVLLAQHADDQAESVLLALSRGAGLRGLSGMATRFVRHDVVFERPLLGCTAVQIRATLRAQNVLYVEDPSNQNTAYTRNKIRLQVQPVLQAAFPQWVQQLERSRAHVAQAQHLLDELASIDALHVGMPPRLALLRTLGAVSINRLGNLLRYWLLQQHQTLPSTAQLQALQKQVMAASTRSQKIHLRIGRGFVVRSLAAAWENGLGDVLQFIPLSPK